MKKILLLSGSSLALLAVLAGAFGAHALKNIISPEDSVTYETAVRYQMYHALAIIITAMFTTDANRKFLSAAGFLFIAGILFFSGSLYLITCLKTQNVSLPLPVVIATPLGGIMFACGWLVLAVSFFKTKY